MRRRLFPLLALLRLALPTSSLAQEGKLFVMVNSANALRNIGKKELIALYTGRSRHFPDDSLAETVDHPRESVVREAFYAALQAELKRNRRAIASLSHEPTDSDLRVVMVLGRAG